MPSINISEQDFIHVAGAAREAKRRGDDDDARALDKIARKINAALSNTRVTGLRALSGSAGAKSLSWQDVPSTLDLD